MGRQKKNELDAILEQLKKSYATDIDDELEDSLLEDEEMEEDAELASVLEKIFASSSDVSNCSSEDPVTDLKLISDTESIQREQDNSADRMTEVSEMVDDKSDINEKFIESAIEEPTEESDNSASFSHDNTDEEEKVDDVFKAMFHQSVTLSANETDDEDETFENPNNNEESTSLFDLFTCDESDMVDAHEDVFEDREVSEYEETVENEESEAIDIDEEDDSLNEMPYEIVLFEEASDDVLDSFEDEDMDYEDDCLMAESLNEDNLGNNDAVEFLYEETGETISEETEKKIVLDPDNYTNDILQHTLWDMTLFKPQEDIDFSSNYSQSESEEEEQVLSGNPSAASLPKTEVTDNDISLLMKFGYSSEIASSVGNEYAQSVIIDKNNEYVPQKHRIIHGFTGKEFSDKSQIEGISKKYKSDKTRLLILSILISLFSVAMLVGDIFAVLSNNVNDYIFLIFLESLITFVTFIILGHKMYSGFLGITRFEANAYSMLTVVLVEYLLYCVAMQILYFISPLLVYNNVYIALGGYVMIYAALTVWGEYIDCCRENNIFTIMSDGDVHCVLEKRINEGISTNEKKSKHTDVIYNVKRSSMTSGFFKRMYDRSVSKVNIVLIIGIAPFVAIVIGLMTAMFRGNVTSGINAAGYVLFCTVPLSSVFVPSVIEYIHSVKLSRAHSAYIGFDSVNEYSNLKTLSFNDYDTVEISALTEINPNSKISDSPKKWVNIAAKVFDALGGPLSKTVKTNSTEESNVTHDATINSISENGIDLYFDSAMNVLIGDRQYMLAHNIKVKIDTNLSTAVKGVERTVIYMAFDGIPQLGFIVTSKIKRSFMDTVELLEKYKIQIRVNSFEPEINDYYFESNGIGNTLFVHKPTTYEHSGPLDFIDSGIISSNPHDLCRAVIYGKAILDDRRITKKAIIIQTGIGFILAVLLVALTCFVPSNGVIAIIQSYSLLILYLVSIIGLIPGIVQIVKLIRRK